MIRTMSACCLTVYEKSPGFDISEGHCSSGDCQGKRGGGEYGNGVWLWRSCGNCEESVDGCAKVGRRTQALNESCSGGRDASTACGHSLRSRPHFARHDRGGSCGVLT